MRTGWIRALRTVVLRIATVAGGLLIAVVSAAYALAQLPVGSSFGVPASQQINNPAVSPFLNLAQPGINPGVAYQTLVAPQLQLGNAVALQQQQIGLLQQQTSATTPNPQLVPGTMLQTGHPTAFMNTLNYFPQPNLKH